MQMGLGVSSLSGQPRWESRYRSSGERKGSSAEKDQVEKMLLAEDVAWKTSYPNLKVSQYVSLD
jgi:hypothetical protein